MAGKSKRVGTGMEGFPEGNPRGRKFEPGNMDSSVIALPLLRMIDDEARTPRKAGAPLKLHDVIIDLNLAFPGGRVVARDLVLKQLDALIEERKKASKSQAAALSAGVEPMRRTRSEQYLFGSLDAHTLQELVRRDVHRKVDGAMVRSESARIASKGAKAAKGPKMMGMKDEIKRAIYHVWPDFQVKAFIDKSQRTVKADAARFSFSAEGEGITWAVLDSGIDEGHPHFKLHDNLKDMEGDAGHRDFTGGESPLTDAFGHGTHVAGILAGEFKAPLAKKTSLTAFTKLRDESGEIKYQKTVITKISGMAPKCRLLSLKVLDSEGAGKVSGLIAALDYIREINGNGGLMRVHGVNMSLGYDFDPEWFACGQSPLCVEVDRLVRSGVVVVVAAGNTGYAYVNDAFKGVVASGMDLSINDPGNSALAITVGSTHKDSPHIYGVSYFSSKGPTGDGRLKPDLVAPGEKILSCAAGKPREDIKAETGEEPDYREHSGTSMAAPHVSGVIAAFLSVRREFIGQPERIKEIFLTTATDLKRERYFQGHGLVDLMRAFQSV